ncbi:hypothetical protein MHF_0964 [Mycoplasma haemofelis Ohio2]|uniref:Uncharacterized protein n=1 Tax=Mycoplasma haemofelis (strain Ohio2) TaxID=859194 RepID=F6FJ23_MYCHI|nr:hypothetical protein MHF_0964 [Mycoplasma haemofelis Ohio2]
MDPKLLGLTGALGTAAAGGGVYWSMQSSKQPISNLLSSEKALLLITDYSDSKWSDAWKKYKSSNGEGNKWGIRDWLTKKDSNEAPTEFKEECKKRAESKVSGKSDQEYQDIKDWCTRPKKISELLSFEGKKVLLSQTGDSEEWGKMWTSYKKHHENGTQAGNSGTTYKTPDELGVSDWTNKAKESSIPNEYKTACQTKAESHIDISKITEDPNFQKVEKWCTRDKQ